MSNHSAPRGREKVSSAPRLVMPVILATNKWLSIYCIGTKGGAEHHPKRLGSGHTPPSLKQTLPNAFEFIKHRLQRANNIHICISEKYMTGLGRYQQTSTNTASYPHQNNYSTASYPYAPAQSNPSAGMSATTYSNMPAFAHPRNPPVYVQG
jgi:hypothetical protein